LFLSGQYRNMLYIPRLWIILIMITHSAHGDWMRFHYINQTFLVGLWSTPINYYNSMRFKHVLNIVHTNSKYKPHLAFKIFFIHFILLPLNNRCWLCIVSYYIYSLSTLAGKNKSRKHHVKLSCRNDGRIICSLTNVYKMYNTRINSITDTKLVLAGF